MIRIAFLAATLLGAQVPGIRQDGPLYPLDTIRRQCVEFSDVKIGKADIDARECAVSDFGEIGVVEGTTYYYARYCVIPGYADPGRCGDGSFAARYNERRGLAIFVREAAGARLVFEYVDREISNSYFPDPPAFVPHAAGTLLNISIRIDGTGVGNDSQYYLRSNGRWERLDFGTWHKDLLSRLPKGLQIWKGIWPDLKTMRATAGLYRDGDANCCPTGGTAEVQLGIRGRQFVIESINITREPQR